MTLFLHKKGSVKTLFFYEKGLFGLKSLCFTANRRSFQCLKFPYCTMKKCKISINPLEKGVVFNSQIYDGYPLLMALTLPEDSCTI